MTRGEFNQGIEQLALRFSDFDIPKTRLDAWYDDLRSLSPDLWVICIWLIGLEEEQWWSKNLTALVHVRVGRATQIVIEKATAKRKAEEPLLIEERMSEEEIKTGFAKLNAIIGDKGM